MTLQVDESATSTEAAPFIDLLIELRSQLRSEKQFKIADQVRDQLSELGVVIEDTSDGTNWKII